MNIQMVDGIRQLYSPRLNTVSKEAEHGIRYWLLYNDSFIPSFNSSNNSMEFILYDGSEMLRYLAKDISRLSCAAIESLSSIQESINNKKFLAWQMVKAYYAAFYAAHSTLKICGMGLTQIDQRTIQRISRRAASYGFSIPQIKAGIYCIDFDTHVQKMISYYVSKYDDSHRGLWRRYIDLISIVCGTSIRTNHTDSNCIRIKEPSDSCTQSIYNQLPAIDAGPIVNRLEALKNALNKKGDSNWLSYIRNEINYNHAYGLWFPYKLYEEEYSYTLNNKTMFIDNPLSNRFDFANECELKQFFICCQLIVAINREMVEDLAKRHPDNKSFIRNDILRALNNLRVQAI